MDENVQQNSDDIFSTFSQTWTNGTTGQFSNNHPSGSSVWEILENAVNSIENSDASNTLDRDGFRSHSDDLSDFITREPRFSSAFDNTNYQMVNVPQGQMIAVLPQSKVNAKNSPILKKTQILRPPICQLGNFLK